VAGTNSHYTYDPTVYTITDIVNLDDSGDLVLTRTIKIASGEAVEGTLNFTNQFTAKPVTTATIDIQKIVKGEPKTDETFTFELTSDQNTFPMPSGIEGKQDVTITGPGTATFGSWTYSTPGVYTYHAREVSGDNTEYAYDATVYEITDTVILNDAGDLVVNRVVQKSVGKTVDGVLAFSNQYKPQEEFPGPPENPPVNPPVNPPTQTGDISHPYLFLLLAILSLGMLVALCISTIAKKRKMNKQQ
jgi:pilin isopeptide linkage protein